MVDRKLSDEISRASANPVPEEGGPICWINPILLDAWAGRVAKLEAERDRLCEERGDVESALVSAGIDAPNRSLAARVGMLAACRDRCRSGEVEEQYTAVLARAEKAERERDRLQAELGELRTSRNRYAEQVDHWRFLLGLAERERDNRVARLEAERDHLREAMLLVVTACEQTEFAAAVAHARAALRVERWG